jgi:cell division protein FtsL
MPRQHPRRPHQPTRQHSRLPTQRGQPNKPTQQAKPSKLNLFRGLFNRPAAAYTLWFIAGCLSSSTSRYDLRKKIKALEEQKADLEKQNMSQKIMLDEYKTTGRIKSINADAKNRFWSLDEQCWKD